MRWLDWASFDKRLKLSWFAIFVVALGACAVRAPRLSLRPMHTDEAVHADKFGTLLETGLYKYDPGEYHGPTLNYFTLIPAWLSGVQRYTQVTEVTLRIVTVVFGVLLVVLLVFLADGLGAATVPAAVLTALSPAMVFYSRYYIQEILLVCFTFGVILCGYRYVRTRALPWAMAAGACVGLMHATKETAIAAFGALGLALLLVVLAERSKGRPMREIFAGVRPLHLLLAVAVGVGVSALFYSAFFRYPRGILNSYLAYTTYFGRAAGENTAHVHPWYYYLQILLFSRYGHGPIWTEGWIALLALVGLAAAVKGPRLARIDPKLVRFVALYTVALTVVYSAIPYKTPWCVLGFLHGMILLAGVGAVALLAWLRSAGGRVVGSLLLLAAAGHLAFEAYRASYVYHADSRNPYVYAHPTEEVLTVVEKVKEYVGLSGLGQSEEAAIQVVMPGDDYWPLPWYLRSLKVEWRHEVPERIGPLILISDKLEEALTRRLYVETPRDKWQMYMYLFDQPYYVWFRPQVKLLGFVRKSLWDEHTYRPSSPTEQIEGKRGG